MGDAVTTTQAITPLERHERRGARRRPPHHPEPLERIRLRTGRDAAVLDVSDSGALIEGGVRLLPGTHVDAHVVTAAGRLLVRSRVVRAWVSALVATGPTYRSALAFQQRVDTARAGYVFPGPPASPANDGGTTYPAPAGDDALAGQEGVSA
jgi:hypothetical protein